MAIRCLDSTFSANRTFFFILPSFFTDDKQERRCGCGGGIVSRELESWFLEVVRSNETKIMAPETAMAVASITRWELQIGDMFDPASRYY